MASVTVTTYDKGDVVRIEAVVAVAGVPTNPTTSTLTVTDPLGVVTTYTIANGGLTNPTAGTLRHDHDTTSAPTGEHKVKFTGTGAAQVAEKSRFYVAAD